MYIVVVGDREYAYGMFASEALATTWVDHQVDEAQNGKGLPGFAVDDYNPQFVIVPYSVVQ